MTTEYNKKARQKAKEYLKKNWVLHPEYDSKKNAHHHSKNAVVLDNFRAVKNALPQYN